MSEEGLLDIKTPRWCLPLLEPKRYKGAKGGRGSGKSHFFAEAIVEAHIIDPNHRTVCIREVQKSISKSSMLLIKDKIKELGVSHLFDVLSNEIRNKDGDGIMVFQGMQDHTADSIKSLEGFDKAWIEEAQSISRRSMELLLPTIRKEDSEIWFSWNPDLDDNPVETHFAAGGDDMVCVHVNYQDNPFLPDTLRDEAERHKRVNPDTFDHVWLGGFATKSDAQIFKDKFELKDFEIDDSFGDPLHGMDFGFSQDPSTGIRVYIRNNILYISHEAYKAGLELDDTATYIKNNIPGIEKYVIRADNARPESISYLRRHGLQGIVSVDKWPGSIMDGIEYMRNFDKIVIHPRCEQTAREFRLYSYKVDKRTGDILPDIVDDFNHVIDAIRYALSKLIKAPGEFFIGRA